MPHSFRSLSPPVLARLPAGTDAGRAIRPPGGVERGRIDLMRPGHSKGCATMALPKMYRVKEVAAALNVSEDTVRKWIEDGVIKSEKVGGCVLVYESSLPKDDGAKTSSRRK